MKVVILGILCSGLALVGCRTTNSALSEERGIKPSNKTLQGELEFVHKRETVRLSYVIEIVDINKEILFSSSVVKDATGEITSDHRLSLTPTGDRCPCYSNGEVEVQLGAPPSGLHSIIYFGYETKIFPGAAGAGEVSSTIDRQELAQLMEDAPRRTADNADAVSLYEALAMIVADRNCSVDSMRAKQEYQTRGIERRRVVVDGVTSIGGGRILVFDDQSRKHELPWDANHLTPMTVKDWHQGLKAHEGFYPQLKKLKLCR